MDFIPPAIPLSASAPLRENLGLLFPYSPSPIPDQPSYTLGTFSRIRCMARRPTGIGLESPLKEISYS